MSSSWFVAIQGLTGAQTEHLRAEPRPGSLEAARLSWRRPVLARAVFRVEYHAALAGAIYE